MFFAFQIIKLIPVEQIQFSTVHILQKIIPRYPSQLNSYPRPFYLRNQIH
jgi:hypothetical protein